MLSSFVLFTGTLYAMVRIIRHHKRRLRRETVSASCAPLARGHTSTKEDVLSLRKAHFAKAISISYANTDPLMIVRGEGSRLIDENGQSYLDTRNNVAHVGHSHPTVVKAIQKQVELINTNTRYLHPNMAILAERLSAKLPDPLSVVFFCNSGSEANDLALRLARAYTGSDNTIVVDRAYHGHTMKVLQVSPYKYEHGSEFALSKPHPNCDFESPHTTIWKVPCPDVYRGKHCDPNTAGKAYAAYVEEACRFYQRRGESVGAMILEGGMSVAGVVLPPTGYLEACARAVRGSHGLIIADEVQTGFGRLGSCYWAFQYRHANADNASDPVVPDIVTIGKPFGNGMPLAAVVTNRAVADRFDALGIELFNTFGGNPVCTAAGLAVLDVLESEQLQERAFRVGKFLTQKFRDMANRVQLIGDVRGSGLFLGIELVRDRDTFEPATEESSFICSTLKSEYRVLTSLDGPHENVIVIKPPMVFSRDDCDFFLRCFEDAAIQCQHITLDRSVLGRTPT